MKLYVSLGVLQLDSTGICGGLLHWRSDIFIQSHSVYTSCINLTVLTMTNLMWLMPICPSFQGLQFHAMIEITCSPADACLRAIQTLTIFVFASSLTRSETTWLSGSQQHHGTPDGSHMFFMSVLFLASWTDVRLSGGKYPDDHRDLSNLTGLHFHSNELVFLVDARLADGHSNSQTKSTVYRYCSQFRLAHSQIASRICNNILGFRPTNLIAITIRLW